MTLELNWSKTAEEVQFRFISREASKDVQSPRQTRSGGGRDIRHRTVHLAWPGVCRSERGRHLAIGGCRGCDGERDRGNRPVYAADYHRRRETGVAAGTARPGGRGPGRRGHSGEFGGGHEAGLRSEGIGRSTLRITTDVAKRASLQELHDRVVADLGDVDILVNSAGVTKRVSDLRESAGLRCGLPPTSRNGRRCRNCTTGWSRTWATWTFW